MLLPSNPVLQIRVFYHMFILNKTEADHQLEHRPPPQCLKHHITRSFSVLVFPSLVQGAPNSPMYLPAFPRRLSKWNTANFWHSKQGKFYICCALDLMSPNTVQNGLENSFGLCLFFFPFFLTWHMFQKQLENPHLCIFGKDISS